MKYIFIALVISGNLAAQAIPEQPASRRPSFSAPRNPLSPPPPEHPRPLEREQELTFTVPPFGFHGNAKCSSNGDVFFHVDSGEFNQAVVLKLSRKSKDGKVYLLPDQDADTMAFNGFAVSPDGTLAMLIDGKEGPFVAMFDKDGALRNKHRLDLPDGVDPQSFAMFDDSTMLVKGVYGRKAKQDLRGKRFGALVSSAGTILKQYDGLGSTSLDQPQTIFDSSTVLGDDGYVYMLNRDQVLVSSQAGEIARRLRFVVPDADAPPVGLQVSAGIVSVTMRKVTPDKRVQFTFLLLNATSGDRIGYYAPDTSEGSSLPLCFRRDEGYTFYRPKQGQLRLVTANYR